jgi:Uma2 family endonuclease
MVKPAHVFQPEPDPTSLPGEDELPFDFGPPMESTLHRSAMNDLITSLEAYLRAKGDTTTFVGGNLAIYFSIDQIEHNTFLGPDFMVVRNTSLRERKSWVFWSEQRFPSVVIELLSDKTEKDDRGAKMSTYAEVMQVAEYVLFDPFDGRLEGYRLDTKARRYVVIPPDEEERVEVEQLGLCLAVHWQERLEGAVPLLRWQLPDGTPLPTPAERAAQQQRRAEDQERRAEAAEAELAILREKLSAAGLI